jgi:hypothetical protein
MSKRVAAVALVWQIEDLIADVQQEQDAVDRSGHRHRDRR